MQIEGKFFTGGNTYFFGEKVTCVDFVFYQELLSAMILSGNGTTSEFFTSDSQTQNFDLKNMTKWYQAVASHHACKAHAFTFMEEMNKQLSGKSSRRDSVEPGTERSGSGKRVHFAKDRSVRFSQEEQEEHE